MLTDKQIIRADSDAELVFLLDAASLNGDLGTLDPLQERATQLLLEYRNAPCTSFLQMSGESSMSAGGISLLTLTKNDPEGWVLYCEAWKMRWFLMGSFQDRLPHDGSQPWANMPASEKIELAALVTATANIDESAHGWSATRTPRTCLLVTMRPHLLNQQILLQKFAGGGVLRVITPTEAARILDLWLKLHGLYLLRYNGSCDEYSWYQIAALSDLPQVLGLGPLREPIVQRMAAIRYGVDMLGKAYYWHNAGSARAQQEYHFSSTVMLMTALLDCLALAANARLQRPFDDWKVSLSPPHGDGLPSPFRKAVRRDLPDVDELWARSGPFLRLLYHVIRNPLAHQSGLGPVLLHGYQSPWQGQLAFTTGVTGSHDHVDLTELRAQCGEVPLPYENYTSLGFSREDLHGALGDSQQLELYLFSREAWLRCRRLTNRTLELMGYSDILASETTAKGASLENSVAIFRQTALDGLELTASEYSKSQDMQQETGEQSCSRD